MRIFPGKRVEQLLNQAVFSIGSTPARVAFYTAHFMFLTATINLIVSTIICLVTDSNPVHFAFLLGTILAIHSDWVLSKIFNQNLTSFFLSMGIITIFHLSFNIIYPHLNTNHEQLIFLLALNWSIIDRVCIGSQQAISEEQKVLEQGFLPVAPASWIIPLFVITVICGALNSILIVRAESLFLNISLSFVLLTEIGLAVVCLLRSIIPRPPSKQVKSVFADRSKATA